MKKSKIKFCAFTLPEVLISGSLALLVAVIAFQIFFPVFKMWRKIGERAEILNDSSVCIERIGALYPNADKKNIFVFAAFDGGVADVVYSYKFFEKTDDVKEKHEFSERVLCILPDDKGVKNMYTAERTLSHNQQVLLYDLAGFFDSLSLDGLAFNGWKVHKIGKSVVNFKVCARTDFDPETNLQKYKILNTAKFRVLKLKGKSIPYVIVFSYKDEKDKERILIMNAAAEIIKD